jgi:hypothetical protein
MHGRFCHQCGQAAADHLGSLRGFAAHIAETLFQYDSRGLRTAISLLFRPGAITAEYVAGRRSRYVGPVQAYAISAALLFLAGAVHPLVSFNPRTHWFTSTLGGTIGFTNPLTSAEVTRLSARGVSLDVFGERFVGSVTAHLSTFLVASVPLFAIALAVVYVRERRPLPHHAVFALYWSAFYLFVMAIGQLLPVWMWSRPFAPAVQLVWTLVYLGVAVHRVYGGRWPGAVMRAVVLMVVYQIILYTWIEMVIGQARNSI